MRIYYCYNCYNKLRSDHSYDKCKNENDDQDPFILSEYGHIATEYICDNPNCNLLHIEEVDIDDNIIYFGPLYKDKRL